MKPQILLIHGFNVWDKGKSTVGELRGYFAELGYAYHILKYGHFGLWDVRTKNDNVARQVAEFISNSERPVIVVGHSNGCAIIYLAMKMYGAKPKHCVLINPALKRDIKLPRTCNTIDIWHSPSDKPVRMAKYLLKTKLMPWGAMGADGISYQDKRVKQFNKETDYPVSSSSHSDVFSTEKLSFFGPLISKTAIDRAK